MSDIQIYVACLSAYNNGRLHGAWIDACEEVEDIWQQVKAMLAKSPETDAEEWAIHDYSGFEGVSISEYESFESAHEKAVFVEQHGVLGAKLLEHWCGDLEEAQTAFDDDYYGLFTSLADYVQELTEETTEIPESLAYYIDYEKMARDMELNGDLYTIETAFDEVHVFWSR